jgi:hypothetical protein
MPAPTSAILQSPTSQSPLALLETPEQLKEWLEDKQPHDIVGQCGLSDHCVFANFLIEQGSGPYVNVGKFDVMVGTNETDVGQYILPEWCRALIGCIDAYGFGSFIRADRVLALLGEVWVP